MAQPKLRSVKQTLEDYPKLTILVTMFVFLLLFSAFETIRAYLYIKKVEDYKGSAAIMELHNAVQRLVKLSEDERPDPALCELYIDNGIEYVNPAYRAANENDGLDRALRTVEEKLERVIPSPRFSSLLTFVPQITEARSLSGRIAESTQNIQNLTREDKETQYCLALISVISEVYFVSDLRTPQGVEALFVGQIENFQINVNQAQEKLQAIVPPQRFSAYHIELNDFLNDLRINVRQDTNDPVTFAAGIAENYENLSFVFANIYDATDSLRSVPELILLNSAALQ